MWTGKIIQERFPDNLTLNREMVETMEVKEILKFKVEDYERARFTKSERFLGKAYSERNGKRGAVE